MKPMKRNIKKPLHLQSQTLRTLTSDQLIGAFGGLQTATMAECAGTAYCGTSGATCYTSCNIGSCAP